MRAAVVLFALGLWSGLSALAAAADRVALVIGNGAYAGAAALANPVGDATAIAESLKGLDFKVILATNVDRRGAIAAIDQFSKAIDRAELALIFFAGHGIQMGGQNFLLPTDVSVESERALRYSAIDIQEVVAEMERRAEVSIAILDACRDNPFVELVAGSGNATRSVAVARGLGPMRLSGRGAIIAYAAASGDVAADGAGAHSPFTGALLAEIADEQVEVGLMFRRVGRRVIDETHGRQRPELLVRLVDEVYLNPGKPGDTTLAVTNTRPGPSTGKTNAVEATAGTATSDGGASGEGSSLAVADAGAPDIDRTTGAGTGRFFGARTVRPPPWVAGLTLPKPTGWRSLAPAATAETAGNDSYGTAQPLPLAAAVEARVVPRGDPDWYSVDVPTAGELKVDVENVPPEIDLYARVWNADHQVVADWQGGARPGGALAARFPLPVAGRYWIEMSDGNNDAESSQSFNVAVDFAAADDPFEPNNSSGAAAPIPIKVEASPSIFPRADADWYKVWIPGPGLLSVKATDVPQALDIAIRIWDLNGRVVRDWVLPPRAGGDTVLEAELAEPGTYLIETADSNSDAATVEPFRLTADFRPVADTLEPNNVFGEASIVLPSSARPIAIFPRGDADWLAFDIDQPGELKLSAAKLPENLDVYMRIWTADKQVLRDWFGPPRVGGDVEGFADLPTAGRYFVEVADGNNDQASPDLFDLALAFTAEPDQYEPNNGPADATPLTPGGKILFNILPRGDADWFRVDAASAGELAITIDEGPDNLDLYYRVWDANHQVVRDWIAPYKKGGVTEGFADLPRPGVYFIEIADGNNDERSVQPATLSTIFTPTLDTREPDNSFGNATPLALDTVYRANILPQGDSDWYLLQAAGAGKFSIAIDEVDPALDVSARLWDSEARPGEWHGPPRPGGVTQADIAVSAAGTYRLEVVDGNNDARSKNPYRIQVSFR